MLKIQPDNSKEQFKCKACTRLVERIDKRKLCTHCAHRIDRADAIASDINGIREDMYEVGIPTVHHTSLHIHVHNLNTMVIDWLDHGERGDEDEC